MKDKLIPLWTARMTCDSHREQFETHLAPTSKRAFQVSTAHRYKWGKGERVDPVFKPIIKVRGAFGGK